MEAAKVLLENSDSSLFFNLSWYQLWKVKDRNSLRLIKRLVGDVVTKVVPFHSIDFIFTGYQYSVLRLGLDGELWAYGGMNFEEAIAQAKIGLQIWRRDAIKSVLFLFPKRRHSTYCQN